MDQGKKGWIAHTYPGVVKVSFHFISPLGIMGLTVVNDELLKAELIIVEFMLLQWFLPWLILELWNFMAMIPHLQMHMPIFLGNWAFGFLYIPRVICNYEWMALCKGNAPSLDCGWMIWVLAFQSMVHGPVSSTSFGIFVRNVVMVSIWYPQNWSLPRYPGDLSEH